LACLAPQPLHVDSTYQALENVLLHHFLGLDHFHVYDGGLTNRFMQILSADKKEFNLKVAILPWNVPVAPLSSADAHFLVQTDCHMRAKAQGFGTSITLELSQILVPRSGAKTIRQALDQSQKKGQLIVDVLKFCSEYPEDMTKTHERKIVALQQSIYNSDLSSGHSVRLSHKSRTGDQHKVSRDELAVHDYSDCNNYDMDIRGAESVRDRTITRLAAKIEAFLGKDFPMSAAKYS
jgi:hypothetical protein